MPELAEKTLQLSLFSAAQHAGLLLLVLPVLHMIYLQLKEQEKIRLNRDNSLDRAIVSYFVKRIKLNLSYLMQKLRSL
ncbi:hypothetical protein D0C36_23845 [Mucilaginibacter conchicola]|uniref:Uncharacterized protein n=1 Tax=Mucilaginibacter conchicola TaxID=2303333 RepID=A0A372NP25_9SPHI|nr:hypothetical protein D0C36_23845 [Mucilaginibacter conchicola]